MRRARSGLAWLATTLVAGCTLLSSPDELEGGTPRCPLGRKPCGHQCVSIDDPSVGCAASSCSPCVAAHGQSICVGGRCALGPCEQGFADCDGDGANGCEVDPRVATESCGACGNSCGSAVPLCVDSVCVPRCGAARFSRASARLTASAAGYSLGEGDYTLELWVRQHRDFAAPAGGNIWTMSPGDVDGLQLSWSPNALMAVVTKPKDANWLDDEGLGDLAWHHYAFVRRGAVHTLYRDGVARSAFDRASNAVVERGGVAMGAVNDTPTTAPPVSIGPLRLSKVARYDGRFTPKTYWPIDADTLTQYFTSRAFNGNVWVDETGGGHDALHDQGVVNETETPCVR